MAETGKEVDAKHVVDYIARLFKKHEERVGLSPYEWSNSLGMRRLYECAGA